VSTVVTTTVTSCDCYVKTINDVIARECISDESQLIIVVYYMTTC